MFPLIFNYNAERMTEKRRPGNRKEHAVQLLDKRHRWGNHLGTSTRHCRLIFCDVALQIQRPYDVLSDRSMEIRKEQKNKSVMFVHI